MNKLNEIIEDIFNINDTEILDELDIRQTKKWDSLNHIKLIMAIESKFKISIDPDEALRLLSFKEIVKFIKKK